MKQQLIEWARNTLRAMPLPMRFKYALRDSCFTHLPRLFDHLPAYQMWVLQNPTAITSKLEKENLPEKRAAALAGGEFNNSTPSILMVSHSLGGGTEHHLRQLGRKLEQEGMKVWALRALGREWVRLVRYDTLEEEGLIYRLPAEQEELLKQLSSMNIRLLHVHHLVDFVPGFLQTVSDWAKKLGVPYDFTVHDYLSICPRYTLYDEAVRGYCGEPDVGRCAGCVRSFGSAAGKEVDVEIWRQDYAEFLTGARQVYTPDEDVKNRLTAYLPQAKLVNRPHWDEAEITPLPRHPHDKLRILTLGAIAPHKGSMVLKECAEDAKKRGLPLEFTLIGFSDIDWKLKPFMPVTGPYKPQELPGMLQAGEFDMVFLPAVWPETFNYTLSEVLHYGLYPVSFDLGAIGRRIKELGYGTVLPYKLYRDAAAINDALLKITLPPVPVEKLRAAQMHYASILKDYYNLDITSAT